MGYTCALCGEYFENTRHNPKYYRPVNVYMERGVSKNHFLCKACYEAKDKICDCGCKTEERTNAINMLQKHIENKSDLIQNIVKSWIDGEEKNCHTGVNDLVYYVPGPLENLFVFKDHLTILSSYYDCTDSAPWDCVMFYKYERNGEKYDNYFFDLERNRNSDIKTINGEGITTNNTYSNMSLELNMSLGDWGELLFTNYFHEHKFYFYYHHNKLMEEVLHYIMKQVTNPDAGDEEVVQTVGDVQKTAEKQIEKNEEAPMVAYSPADEIRKMKELMDCGILTREEFDRAKNKLIDKL